MQRKPLRMPDPRWLIDKLPCRRISPLAAKLRQRTLRNAGYAWEVMGLSATDVDHLPACNPAGDGGPWHRPVQRTGWISSIANRSLTNRLNRRLGAGR